MYPASIVGEPVIKEGPGRVAARPAQGARAAQLDAEEALRTLLEGSRDAVWLWDLTTGRVHFSRRWQAMLGCSSEDVSDSPDDWFRRVHPADLPAFRAAVSDLLEGAVSHVESEFRIMHRSGTWRTILCCGASPAGARVVGGSLTDLTEKRTSEDRLLHEALHDRLTDLPRRRLFIDRLDNALARTRREGGGSLAVLYVDLDRFRNLNDSLGRDAGDRALLEVAARFRDLLRPGDTLARLGGDTFVFLLEFVSDEGDAVLFAEEIRQALSRPLTVDGEEIFVSASIGIALPAGEDQRSDDLLHDANTALHQAKGDPSMPHEVFVPSMSKGARERLRLEAALHRALERRELVVFYQPVVALGDGHLRGFEALVRWRQPERGLVPPGSFVPIAEETGLIVEMGRQVLEEACASLSRWRAEFPGARDLTMAVNISGRQFEDPGLATFVEELIGRHGLEDGGLELEITESVVMANTHGNASHLRRLRSAGVGLLIDDFGTGHSSLASLQSFPIDTLKIDRSFVSRLEHGEENGAIVQAIVGLARSLGLGLIAEGIETRGQRERLAALGCEKGQGFLFSAPVDASAAACWLGGRVKW